MIRKNRSFLSSPAHKVAQLYGKVMTAARAPIFYQRFALPDTLESRFELLILHMFLILRRLHAERSEEASELARCLTEFMVSDLDRTLREMGVGDVGVVKRMKLFMESYYGHCAAYEAAMNSADKKDLLRVLDRNVFAELSTDLEKLNAMRDYMMQQEKALAGQGVAVIAEGTVEFVSL